MNKYVMKMYRNSCFTDDIIVRKLSFESHHVTTNDPNTTTALNAINKATERCRTNVLTDFLVKCKIFLFMIHTIYSNKNFPTYPQSKLAALIGSQLVYFPLQANRVW